MFLDMSRKNSITKIISAVSSTCQSPGIDLGLVDFKQVRMLIIVLNPVLCTNNPWIQGGMGE